MTEVDTFSNNIVQKYQYWTWYVHDNQNYLGRSILWCHRDAALDLTDATSQEMEELQSILRIMKKTLEAAFGADWMNYAFLGNGTRHLHGHVVPRYSSERIFADQTFIDKRWGNNWETDQSFQTTPEILQLVKKALQDNLP